MSETWTPADPNAKLSMTSDRLDDIEQQLLSKPSLTAEGLFMKFVCELRDVWTEVRVLQIENKRLRDELERKYTCPEGYRVALLSED